jgi:hypothetical protein
VSRKRVRLEPPPRTGWPPPELAQDDHSKLSKWFAGKPGARRLAREAGQKIMDEKLEKDKA